jgi:hypothetical protein
MAPAEGFEPSPGRINSTLPYHWATLEQEGATRPSPCEDAAPDVANTQLVRFIRRDRWASRLPPGSANAPLNGEPAVSVLSAPTPAQSCGQQCRPLAGRPGFEPGATVLETVMFAVTPSTHMVHAGGVEPPPARYQRAALPLSYAWLVSQVGFEPTTAAPQTRSASRLHLWLIVSLLLRNETAAPDIPCGCPGAAVGVILPVVPG